MDDHDDLATAVAGDNARLTSQIALPQDSCESVFAADSGYSASIANMSGVSLATVTGTPTTTMAVSLAVGVAAKSQNTQSGNGSPGMPPSGAAGSPPPGGQGPGGGAPPR